MLKELKEQGVRGVTLGVARSNERAFAFYQKMGFEILGEDEGGYALGIRLKEEK
jgi:ribosomal protein S18 acetylase RimI-like enzyme